MVECGGFEENVKVRGNIYIHMAHVTWVHGYVSMGTCVLEAYRSQLYPRYIFICIYVHTSVCLSE